MPDASVREAAKRPTATVRVMVTVRRFIAGLLADREVGRQ
jgi:hypothetical protein